MARPQAQESACLTVRGPSSWISGLRWSIGFPEGVALGGNAGVKACIAAPGLSNNHKIHTGFADAAADLRQYVAFDLEAAWESSGGAQPTAAALDQEHVIFEGIVKDSRIPGSATWASMKARNSLCWRATAARFLSR